jgi:NADP-dependent 3-hydroxy acid dehydrogenase YdfG
MPAMAIAEAIAYALTQPASVAVNEIIVRPLAAQAF